MTQFPPSHGIATEEQLAATALALGGHTIGGPLSAAEQELVRDARGVRIPASRVEVVRRAILKGEDPLGSALVALRDTELRRNLGQFLTDPPTVRAMVSWVTRHSLGRVVDVGCGSGRFSVAAAQALPHVEIVAVDSDPLATLTTRANLFTLLGQPSESGIRVVNQDFLSLALPTSSAPTAFLGNPPYVRHHRLSPETKRRGQALASSVGNPISGLAGLHAYFFMQIANLSRAGDIGCLITSSEWLDVGYGTSLRSLLSTTLRLSSLHLRATDGNGEFEDALTSAVISCFASGGQSQIVSLNKVVSGEVFDLDRASRTVTRGCLQSSHKWGRLFEKPVPSQVRLESTVPLGDVFKVSRGVATGHNRFFVMEPEQAAWHSIRDWVTPVVSSATEIHAADGVLRRGSAKRVLLSIPRDTRLSAAPMLQAYLRVGEELGVPERYICAHRKPWWAVRPPKPAPIVATYMGRRPPVFALNPDALPLLNVALGLRPHDQVASQSMEAWVNWLNENAVRFSGQGRTYQGGLQKFEPREMEALRVPSKLIDGHH